MKHIIIAPVGENMDSLFMGLKEFSVEKVILMTTKENTSLAEKTRDDLEKFRIQSNIITITDNFWQDIFKNISEMKKIYPLQEIVINVASGDKELRCAITSAAFVNGLRAFTIYKDKPLMLPILRFSYYKILTDRKMQILKLLYQSPDWEMNLESISKNTKMSLPLISYHINGNLKSEGLKELGLVTSREEKGRSFIKLSTLGNLLIEGYGY